MAWTNPRDTDALTRCMAPDPVSAGVAAERAEKPHPTRRAWIGADHNRCDNYDESEDAEDVVVKQKGSKINAEKKGQRYE